MSDQDQPLANNEEKPNNEIELSKSKIEDEQESPLYSNNLKNLPVNPEKMSMPIKNPSYSYLENLEKTSYLFITNNYVKCAFYVILIFVILISAISIIFFYKNILIMIISLVLMLFIFIASSIYPYGLEVRVNIQNKAIELKKKSMIQFFNIFSIQSYYIFDCKEFSLSQRDISKDGIIEYSIDLYFLNKTEPINIFEIWGFKNESIEYENKCKNLNKFLGEDVRQTVLRLTQKNINQQQEQSDDILK
jgi:hypothetical protein